MSIPCFDDTNCLKWTVNTTTRHAQADIQVSPAGGLSCTLTGLALTGIGVIPSGSAPCASGLVKDGLGNIYSKRGASKLTGHIAGSQVDIPATGASGVSGTPNYTNGSGCTKLVLALFEVKVVAETTGTNEAIALLGSVHYAFNTPDANGRSAMDSRIDLQGYSGGAGRGWSYRTIHATVFRIPTGGTIVTDVNFSTDLRQNLSTGGAGKGFQLINTYYLDIFEED